MRLAIGLARDVRGIVAATHNRPTYLLAFDALFPKHIKTFVRCVEVRVECGFLWFIHTKSSLSSSSLVDLCGHTVCYVSGSKSYIGAYSEQGAANRIWAIFCEWNPALSGVIAAACSLRKSNSRLHASKLDFTSNRYTIATYFEFISDESAIRSKVQGNFYLYYDPCPLFGWRLC